MGGDRRSRICLLLFIVLVSYNLVPSNSICKLTPWLRTLERNPQDVILKSVMRTIYISSTIIRRNWIIKSFLSIDDIFAEISPKDTRPFKNIHWGSVRWVIILLNKDQYNWTFCWFTLGWIMMAIAGGEENSQFEDTRFICNIPLLLFMWLFCPRMSASPSFPSLVSGSSSKSWPKERCCCVKL